MKSEQDLSVEIFMEMDEDTSDTSVTSDMISSLFPSEGTLGAPLSVQESAKAVLNTNAMKVFLVIS